MTERSLRSPYLPATEWTYNDVVLLIVAWFAGALVAGIIIGPVNPDDIGPGEVSIGLIGQSAAQLGVLAWLSQSRGTGSWREDFGLVARLADSWGVVLGFLLQLTVAIVMGSLIQALGPEDPPRQGITEVAERIEGGMTTLVFLFLIVVVAPLVEELVFRGVLLSRLRRTMGPKAAIVTSAAVFSLIHLVDPDAVFAVPGLFVIGVALGWAALRRGNLSLPIFIHAGVNLTGALVLIFGSDLAEVAEEVNALLLF